MPATPGRSRPPRSEASAFRWHLRAATESGPTPPVGRGGDPLSQVAEVHAGRSASLDHRSATNHDLRYGGRLHRVHDMSLEVAPRLKRQVVEIECNEIGFHPDRDGSCR